MKKLQGLSAGSERGVVLVAVLWMVAALTIVVVGLSQSVKGEVRASSRSRQLVSASAYGEAAIQLALQTLVASPVRPSGLTQMQTSFHGQSISVEVTPLSGLIDINNASEALLSRLYVVAGGLDAKRADMLAHGTAELRSAKDARGQAIGFEAPEDLLRVPGFDYPLYAKISGLITSDVQGSGRVNPAAAPPDVLAVLADGNVDRAKAIAAQRAAGQAGIDTTALNGAFVDSSTTQRYRLLARVVLPDASRLLVLRQADLGGGRQDGIPWRIYHADNRFEPELDKGK